MPGDRVRADADDSRSAGEWIARDVTRMAPPEAVVVIDYALVTLFHGDHMGFGSAESPRSTHGECQLAGISDVAERGPGRGSFRGRCLQAG